MWMAPGRIELVASRLENEYIKVLAACSFVHFLKILRG